MSDHASALAHQFEDLDQQRESYTLGMWLFLATEVLFFGGLFAAYTVYRRLYLPAFSASSHHLDIPLGTLNTALLLTSSLTMALAIHALRHDRRRELLRFLLLTMLLGSLFLGIKGIEYSHKFHEHLIPGPHFAFDEPFVPHAQLFFLLYFLMTGLHAFHMVVGVAVLGVIALLAWRGRFSSEAYEPVEMAGLYWHFVDLVWIFLFPLLYLIR